MARISEDGQKPDLISCHSPVCFPLCRRCAAGRMPAMPRQLLPDRLKKRPTSVTLTPKAREILYLSATRRGVSMSVYLCSLIEQYGDKLQQERAATPSPVRGTARIDALILDMSSTAIDEVAGTADQAKNISEEAVATAIVGDLELFCTLQNMPLPSVMDHIWAELVAYPLIASDGSVLVPLPEAYSSTGKRVYRLTEKR